MEEYVNLLFIIILTVFTAVVCVGGISLLWFLLKNMGQT